MNAIHSFIQDKIVLMVGQDIRSFNFIKNVLSELGFAEDKIDFINYSDSAMDLIQEFKPTIIISEYQLSDCSGFDFFRNIKRSQEYYPIHILLTSNLSQSLVAKAAEEDVDLYFLKPFQKDLISSKIIDEIYETINPSDYRKKIITGRDLIECDLNAARLEFEEATKLSEFPSLAYYYLGRIDDSLKRNEVAELEFKQGLEINEIHFKCLTGLYENFLKRGDFESAYEVLHNLVRVFPENELRFAKALHLCIKIKKFDDIKYFYEVYQRLINKDPRITNAMCSALYIAGKFYVNNEKLRLGKLYFKLLKENMDEWKEVNHVYQDKKEEIDFYLRKSA
jgi:CheY-like chemotaxis protein